MVSVHGNHTVSASPEPSDHLARGALHRPRSTPASALRRRDGSRHHAVHPVARDSIPIADRLCSGLVQSVFQSPARRADRIPICQRSSAAPPTEKRSGLARSRGVNRRVLLGPQTPGAGGTPADGPSRSHQSLVAASGSTGGQITPAAMTASKRFERPFVRSLRREFSHDAACETGPDSTVCYALPSPWIT